MKKEGFIVNRKYRGHHRPQVWLNIGFNTDTGSLNDLDIADIERHEEK